MDASKSRDGRDRRDFVAAQDVGLAILDRAHAGAEQAVAEDADGEDHRDDYK